MSYLPTVNERSSWDEVWKIKIKLEALAEHVHRIRGVQFQEVINPASERKDTGREPFTDVPPKVFAYSSLDEWETMATVKLQLSLSAYELELVKFVNQKLLPLLPVVNCPTHVVQAVYELMGIEPKPIYLKLSDNDKYQR